MSRIVVAEAQAWLEPTKLTLAALDTNLLDQIEEEVLDQISSSYDTSGWIDNTNTPKIVRTAIAKMYASWVYNRQYSEDTDQGNPYAQKLLDNATMVISGIIDGTVDIPGIPDIAGNPSFYPNDASSLIDPKDSPDDTSVGPNLFSVNQVF
jgi:hypothetical protein